MRTGGVLATVIVVGSMLVGCGATNGSDEGGFGLGTLTAEDGLSAFARAGVTPERLRGTLTVRDDGCFTWSGESGDGAWIVWPDAAEPDGDDGGRVVLDGGEVVSDGSALSALGAQIALDDLPEGGNPDSYFGAYGAFCDAGSTGVMLLSAVTAG